MTFSAILGSEPVGALEVERAGSLRAKICWQSQVSAGLLMSECMHALCKWVSRCSAVTRCILAQMHVERAHPLTYAQNRLARRCAR